MNTLATIFSLGLVRALLGQAIFMAIGYGLVAAIRAALGLEPAPEPAWVAGAFLGVFGSLLFSGVLTDWLKWIFGKETPLRHGPPEGRPAWTRYFGVDYNHKVIGIQYGITSIAVLLIGGALAIIFRLELAFPGMQFLELNTYNTIFSAHGIIMIASILLGVGAMGNYLVPIMIGAPDMAFPRLNAFSFWVGIPSAINIIVTVLTMRAPGMSLFRMPIFVWGSVAASLIQFTATQTVGLALLMVTMQRLFGLGFFDPTAPAAGIPPGDPILYQHLFWFYSHPVVYVFVLPGLGVISELLPVFTRKPLFGYKWIALSSIAISLVGFLVWSHHMFTSGMDEVLRVPFMFSTLLVAVPTGVKFFSWIGTLWGGKISFPTPMLFVLGAISVFLIGGLSGPILGTVPTDLHLHDSYWIVGHFHATMFGGFVFPFFAALYYWYPKITGRMYNETLGKLHFWLMTPGFWVMSLGQMRVGLMGMRRRIADYDPSLGIEFTHALVTISALIIGWSILIMIYNLVSSARTAPVAARNPWGSRSPEWQMPSPMPELNYDRPFEVVGEPYDYGLADSRYVDMGPAVPVPGD